jgi:mono/diheme cytochrome c family protein
MSHHLRIAFIALVAVAPVAAEDWTAPADAAGLANPVTISADSIAAGKKIFVQNCQICHGPTGKGDGDGAAMLNPKPASLIDPKITSQSDGSLFWKINTGRSMMPGWKAVIADDTQRWHLVNFIRSLSTTAPK